MTLNIESTEEVFSISALCSEDFSMFCVQKRILAVL